MKIKILFSLIVAFSMTFYSFTVARQEHSEVTVSTVVKTVHDNAYSIAFLYNFIASIYGSWTNSFDTLRITAIYETVLNKQMQDTILGSAILMGCGKIVVFGLLSGLEGWFIKRLCKKILNKNTNGLYTETKLEQPA